MIFLYMSKAFDLVNHVTLINKCEIYDIRGLTLKWNESYLTNRYQCVEIELMKTKIQNHFIQGYNIMTPGVPQGNVLGPLFFLLNINDLSNSRKKKCVLFAAMCIIDNT